MLSRLTSAATPWYIRQCVAVFMSVVGSRSVHAQTRAETGITLPDALAQAAASGPQMRIAAAQTLRARGAASQAHVVPNPTIAAQFDERTPTRQATVTQPMAWIVRRNADVATGRAIVARGVSDSAQLGAELTRVVQRAFYGALAANQQRQIASEQVRFADSLVTLAERRVAAGDISEFERDQIAQEAARARISQLQTREQARVATLEFGRAIATPEQSIPTPLGELSDGLNESVVEVSGPTPADVSTMFAVRAAVADSSAVAARHRAATRAQIPIPALIAGVEWGTTGSGAAFDARRTPIIGLSVPLPLWNQGRQGVMEARGAAMEGAARAAEVRLASSAQLTAARVRVTERAERARFAHDSVYGQAQSIRERAVRLFDAGRTGLLPLLDALRVEREVAALAIQELLAFQEARADLSALTGKQQ